MYLKNDKIDFPVCFNSGIYVLRFENIENE